MPRADRRRSCGDETASPACASTTAPRLAGRSRRDGGRHPAQLRARQEGGPALRPRHRRQRHHADLSTRASTRSANACSTAAPPTASSRRCSSRPRSAPTTSPQFGIGRYAGSVTSTKLKVTGIDLFSAGDFMRRRRTREEIVLQRRRPAASTRSSSCKDDKLVGAVLYGDTVDGAWYFQLLRDGTQRHRRSATR